MYLYVRCLPGTVIYLTSNSVGMPGIVLIAPSYNCGIGAVDCPDTAYVKIRGRLFFSTKTLGRPGRLSCGVGWRRIRATLSVPPISESQTQDRHPVADHKVPSKPYPATYPTDHRLSSNPACFALRVLLWVEGWTEGG